MIPETKAGDASRITVEELRPELLQDFLSYFDHDAFADNPEWAECYCMFRYVPSREEWDSATRETNRNGISRLIKNHEAQGFLAYLDGKPVGWCNAAAKRLLPGIDRDAVFRTEGPEKIGSIVCFVVAKSHRGKGITKHLLTAACQGLKGQGLSIVEAYPHHDAKSEADNFPGPLSLYLANGFTTYRRTEKVTIVRKAL